MAVRVMTAMSGGVDSSAAAYILKNNGYDTAGMTMSLYPLAGDTSEADARAVAESIGIPYYTAHLEELFSERVIEPFCRAYMRGETPNPCVMCNKSVKFGAFALAAEKLGYPMMATGHYARIEYDAISGRYLLKKALYIPKDQSYVLYSLTQEQLARTILPLGGMTKEESRDILRHAGLTMAERPESQDICFVPDGCYQQFIEAFTGEKSPDGDFVDTSGSVIGRHSGVIGYTVGQRRGMGVAADRRLYVVSKDAASNTVVLGDSAELFSKRVAVGELNLIALDRLTGSVNVEAKLRYSQRTAKARLIPVSESEVVLEFEEPQRAAAAGQSAVFYDGDCVIGGGIIRGAEK